MRSSATRHEKAVRCRCGFEVSAETRVGANRVDRYALLQRARSCALGRTCLGSRAGLVQVVVRGVQDHTELSHELEG